MPTKNKKGFRNNFARRFNSAKFKLKFFLRFLFKKVFSFFLKIRFIFTILPSWEKRLVLFLSVVIVISGIFFIRERYLSKTQEMAVGGGAYVEGLVGDPSQINPIFAVTETDRTISKLVFRGLTKIGTSKNIVPDIANYKITNHGLTYTFTLKDNLFWHDGSPVISDDVLFTISLLQDENYVGQYAGVWDKVDVSKKGERQIVVTLSSPIASFLESTTFGVLPSHILGGLALDDISSSEFNINPVGCGPYKFVKASAPQESKVKFISLEKFDKYYGSKPHIEKITFNFYSDWKEVVAGFERGEIMGIGNLTPDKEHLFHTKKDLVYHQFDIPQYMGLFFNLENRYLKNYETRKALEIGLNKANILKVYGGEGQVISSPILPGMIGYKKIKTFNYSVKTAKDILKKEGFAFAKKPKLSFKLVTVNNAINNKIAESIKSQYAEIGVQIKIVSVPLTNFEQEYLINKNYDMVLIGENLGLDPDPYPFWHSSQIGNGGLNLSSFQDAHVDQLLVQARETYSVKERAKIYRQVISEITSEIPAIFLYQPKYIFATNRSLRGINAYWLSTDSDRFLFVDEWYLKTKRIAK